jgi:hypothetical protein
MQLLPQPSQERERTGPEGPLESILHFSASVRVGRQVTHRAFLDVLPARQVCGRLGREGAGGDQDRDGTAGAEHGASLVYTRSDLAEPTVDGWAAARVPVPPAEHRIVEAVRAELTGPLPGRENLGEEVYFAFNPTAQTMFVSWFGPAGVTYRRQAA